MNPVLLDDNNADLNFNIRADGLAGKKLLYIVHFYTFNRWIVWLIFSVLISSSVCYIFWTCNLVNVLSLWFRLVNGFQPAPGPHYWVPQCLSRGSHNSHAPIFGENVYVQEANLPHSKIKMYVF